MSIMNSDEPQMRYWVIVSSIKNNNKKLLKVFTGKKKYLWIEIKTLY